MPRLTFEEIEEQLDMEFFLDRESVSYRHTRGASGEQLQIRECPLCNDDRWRCYFGVDTGLGNCFHCGKGFGKVRFIHAQLEKPSWNTVIEVSAEILKEQGWRPRREAIAAIDHGEVKLPVSDPLPLEDGSNLEYLENRGFGSEICKYLGLRLCETGWWMFKDPDGEMQTQSFANRVIIPVFDLDGTLKTFQGRDLTGLSNRKYLFPMELPGTGRYLFNGQNVQATKHVVMGEGAFDVGAIKLALDTQNDLRDVVPVGSFGKHLSYGSMSGDDQLGRFSQLYRRGVRFVTIMWDGERSAFIAALNAAKLLVGLGLTVRIAMLPQGKDPNEVHASEVVRAYREAATYSPSFDLRNRLRPPYQ